MSCNATSGRGATPLGQAATSSAASLMDDVRFAIGVLEAYERGSREPISVVHVKPFIAGVLAHRVQLSDAIVLRAAPSDYRRLLAGQYSTANPLVRLVQDSTCRPFLEV